MLNRRGFLSAASGVAASVLSLPGAVAAAPRLFENVAMRGSIDATSVGVRPDMQDDQSKAFARMLQKASDTDTPVFLPAGSYVISNLLLPRKVRLSGVPGATRIIYGGGGHLFVGEATERVELAGLIIDGANSWLADGVQGLVDLRGVADFSFDNCQLVGSGKHGLALERVGGRIDRSTISGAAEAGIYAVESKRLTIFANTVADCSDGGILVHRWQPGDDGTLITGNRVEHISARSNGTGQYGNGINIFRANNVIVSGNHVSDCAFSAVRANSAGNIQIANNTCLRSGETALYSEFAFEGAVVSNNIVDGAANGISIVNFDKGGRLSVCIGNIVRNLSLTGPYPSHSPGFGVGITVEADTTVSANVIENAPRFGMNIGWGPHLRNVVATGNVIRKAGTGIAVSVVDGAGPAVISHNVIEGAAKGAIVGHRWVEPVTVDLATGGNAGYGHLTVEGNKVL